ncbi:MAG TPA: WD40 repeat domain-containing protein [Anaerolineales bacterium]|nr:WD40 repeat domain-containing protein [Anaerolineales bacterium]
MSTQSGKLTNPYIGPRAFQSGERIYGRDREANQLVNLIIAERIVLLHSPSGAGKTSLIQAALIPRLLEMKFHLLPIVRVNLDTASYLDGAGVPNRYIFSTLLSLEENLHPEEQTPPEKLVELTLSEYLAQRPKPEANRNIHVMIFDQFEEILTLDPTDQEAKREYFHQLGEMLENPNLWALFSMREDFVATLDPYLLPIPGRFSSTFRLDLLDKDAALQAIQQPARQAGVEFEDTVAEKLVDDLRRVQVQQPDGGLIAQLGPYVEPVQLQVVCYRLWDTPRQYVQRITENDLAGFGQVDQSLVDTSLADYYAQQVAGVAEITSVREREIREWFDRKLITEGGLRGTVLMEETRSGGLKNAAIWRLVDAHLVRADKRGGITWFELAHDRLLEPLRVNNTLWFKDNLSLLQIRADLWAQQGHPESLLLRGKDLAESERWAALHPEGLLLSEKEYLNASRLLLERERRAKLLTRLIVILGVMAVILAVFAYKAYLDAEQQTRVAQAGQLAAQSRVMLDAYPPLSMLLAIEALNATENFGEPRQPVAEEALRATLKDTHGVPLAGHTGSVNTLSFSQDGELLATGSNDGTARLWDLRSIDPAAKPLVLQGHTAAITILAFGRDGHWLATGSEDRTVRLWDLSAVDPNGNPVVLPGHNGVIHALAFSPDGRWLATGSDDLTARLWDLQDSNPASNSVVLETKGWVYTLAFSPDGHWLATGSEDGSTRLWNMRAAGQVDSVPLKDNPIILPGHERLIQTLAFSLDGSWLATGSRDHRILLWDMKVIEKSAVPIVLSGHIDWVNALAFSPDGRWLASGSGDKIVRLWDLNAVGQTPQATVLPGHENAVRTLAFSPDSHWLFSGSEDHTVHKWDLQDPNRAAHPIVLAGHESTVNSLAVSSNGRWLATASQDSTVRLWDQITADPAVNPILLGSHSGKVYKVAFSPDGRWLATGGGDFSARLWNLRTAHPEADPLLLAGHQGSIQILAFSPTQRWLATGSLDGNARLWDLQAANPAANPIELRNGGRVTTLAFSPDGEWLATGSEDNTTVLLWNLEATRPEASPISLSGHVGSILNLAFSSDGNWLASGSDDNTARLWDLRAADPAAKPQVISGHTDDVFAVTFSPDNRWLATGSDDHTVRLWDLHVAEPSVKPTILAEHLGEIRNLVFSLDGKWLASGSKDGTARLWKINSADPALGSVELSGHADQILGLVISPDGRWLVTASEDQTARIWDLGNGDPASDSVVLRGYGGAVLTLAFSPDGRWLATGSSGATISDPGFIHLWLLPLDDLKNLACSNVGRNLSRQEWQQYFPGQSYRVTCANWPGNP